MNLILRYLQNQKKAQSEGDAKYYFANLATTGERLAIAREASGKTQDEAAQFMGFKGRSIISRFENGTRTPNLKTIKQLAELYQVDPADLIPESDRPKFLLSDANTAESSVNPIKSTDGASSSIMKPGLLPHVVSDDSMSPLVLWGDILLVDIAHRTGFNNHLACIKTEQSVRFCFLNDSSVGPIGHFLHPKFGNEYFSVDPENVIGAVCELRRRLPIPK